MALRAMERTASRVAHEAQEIAHEAQELGRAAVDEAARLETAAVQKLGHEAARLETAALHEAQKLGHEAKALALASEAALVDALLERLPLRRLGLCGWALLGGTVAKVLAWTFGQEFVLTGDAGWCAAFFGCHALTIACDVTCQLALSGGARSCCSHACCAGPLPLTIAACYYVHAVVFPIVPILPWPAEAIIYAPFAIGLVAVVERVAHTLHLLLRLPGVGALVRKLLHRCCGCGSARCACCVRDEREEARTASRVVSQDV